jgi:ribosomal protein L34
MEAAKQANERWRMSGFKSRERTRVIGWSGQNVLKDQNEWKKRKDRSILSGLSDLSVRKGAGNEVW